MGSAWQRAGRHPSPEAYPGPVTHDIVIRNGLIADGTGAPPVGGDLAIDGDRITELGPSVTGRGRREIDADGRLVTPGFVDVHTHLDAQLSWDPVGTSSCWHGVTSVVLGNCGVTFAPCKPADRRYLAEMMESVEDIPADSIMSGLDWSWESYGGYLDALERLPKGLNAGGLVGHCAVRYYAMGERSLDDSAATDADIEVMVGAVDEAVAAGALGFSTSRTLLHRVPDGRNVPGTFASTTEVLALADVLRRQRRGLFQAVPAFVSDGDVDPTADIDLLSEVAHVTGRPVTFSLVQSADAPGRYLEVLEATEKACAAGADMSVQTTARAVGLIYGAFNRTPFDRAPAWRELRSLDLAARLAIMGDPAGRARLVADVDAHPPRLPLTDVMVMPDGDARYDLGPSDSLAAHAARMGTTPADAFITLTLARHGRQLLVWAFRNDDMDAVETMLRSPVTIMGLADAGAHVGQILDASQTSFYLAFWVRDRGLCSVGEGVRRLTSQPADIFGLPDRGVLRPGAYADVNVLDLDGLRLPQPEYVHDFPGGAGRFVQRAAGFGYTVVNGQVFMEDGQHTGALAGQVIRSQPA